METKDIFKGIVLKERETRLNISRVPKKIREEFTKFAEEEFEGDYGMLLKHIWDKYKESSFYQNLDLIYRISKIIFPCVPYLILPCRPLFYLVHL